MALTTQLDISLAMSETTTADFGSPTSRVLYAKSIAWATGTGMNQADMRWSDQRTLAGTTSENIDLAGVLVGAFGNTLTFARIKGLLIACLSGKLTIARHDTNGVPLFVAASDAIEIEAGGGVPGIFLWTNPTAGGKAVTAGTGDLIALTAGLADAIYDIHIWGASA